MNKLQIIQRDYQEFLVSTDINAQQRFIEKVGRILGIGEINERHIVERYQDDYSFSELADEFNLSVKQIKEILLKNNVELRTHTVSRKLLKTASRIGSLKASALRIDFPKETLEQMHLTDKLSVKEMSRELGVHKDVIKRNMLQYNIPITSMRGKYKRK